MSLTQLIGIVTTKKSMNDSSAFDFIYNFYAVSGRTAFTKRTLGSSGKFEWSDIELIIDAFIQTGTIETEYDYVCNSESNHEQASTIPFQCDFCKKKVVISDSEHIIEAVYTLKTDFIGELLQYKESRVNSYIHSDYIPIFDLLKKSKHNLIPFLGAGVSVPFGLPTWKGMFLELAQYVKESSKEDYEDLVNRGDFFSAIDFMLMGNSTLFRNEEQIQRHISLKFQDPDLQIDENSHNMKDIAKLIADFYVTTNYDNILINFFEGRRVNPINLPEVYNMPDLFKERCQRVVHIHGNVDRYRTMIVTQNQYSDLYESEDYVDRLKLILTQKSLVFIGYSFRDEFFVKLFQNIVPRLGGDHFFIAPNINEHTAHKFGQEFNLHSISLNLPKAYSTQEYVTALKFLLKELEP